MLYMLIERFKEGSVPEIYQRSRKSGRMMPEGLEYISSWIDLDFGYALAAATRLRMR
jgi:hypothetical protein